MTRQVDLLVIGAGPGGYVAAIRAGQLGLKVLLVDKDNRLGGECLNYGCIPSKALIFAANLAHKARKAADIGIEVSEVRVNAEKLQAWRQAVVDKFNRGVAQLCRANGVDILFGEASFLDPHRVRVTGAQTEDIEAAKIVVATGSEPIGLPTFRFDGKRVLTSKEALELSPLPKDLVVIGGGAIGLELGTYFAKLGTKVTVIEILEQVLPGMEPEVVRYVTRSLKGLGVDVHVKSKATGWVEKDGRMLVSAETPEGPREFVADHVLVTISRKPNTAGLNLEAAGVQADAKGFLPVDAQMRTNVPHIFAVGDVTGLPFLAHKASKQGLVAAEVAAGKAAGADWHVIPATIWTDPEIATVGLDETQAAAKGLAVKVGKVPFGAIGRAMAQGETDGFVKIILDAKTDRILGVQIVGPEAGDLISEATLAIEMGATAEDVALTIHPHPTLPEGIMEAAEAALGRAIHIVNRK